MKALLGQQMTAAAGFHGIQGVGEFQMAFSVQSKLARNCQFCLARSTRNLPGIYQESTRNLPGIYQESTRNLPGIYQESTRNLPHGSASTT